MHRLFCFVLVYCLNCFVVTAAQAAEPLLGSVATRSQQSLNGQWKYILDAYETGQGGFISFATDRKPRDKTDRVEYSFDDSPELAVPGDWNTQDSALFHYEGTVWYRRQFEQPDEGADKRYFLYFDGANYQTSVFLNGKAVRKHEGGFTPFNFDVSEQLRRGTNTLVVGVSNTRHGDAIPAKVTDWYNYGGLTRDVRLVAVPRSYIQNFRVQLAKGSADELAGWVQLAGEETAGPVTLEIPELGLQQELPVDAAGKAVVTGVKLPRLQRWSPDSPKLYDVTLRTATDAVTDRIGFRTLEVRGTEILLNGKSIFLRGVCLHDENPVRGGRAFSRDDAAQSLGWAKEMNCNFLRLAHYPHHENIVRLADEMGLMLWSELPLYWGINWWDDGVKQKAEQQFREIIARDGNRASVIIWSICNETGVNDKRTQFLANIAAHVRSLDDTRLISAALKPDSARPAENADGERVNRFTDPLGEYLDVVAFNDYLGWYDGLPSECAQTRFEIKYQKPLIVSEFGAGAKQGFHADRLTRWSEEYQQWYYQEATQMFDRIDQLRGTSPWILVDFRSPLRHLPGIQDGWNRKGLVSDRGEKKKAFEVMRKFYAEKIREDGE
jgi:beta-glucuronidase